MSENVKFYGGCLHGQSIIVEDGTTRVYSQDTRFVSQRHKFCHAPSNEYMLDNRPYQEVTYEINLYHERRGSAYRCMKIGLLEGSKLLPHEEYEVDRDMMGIPWKPWTPPTILNDINSWWNWCAFRHTANESYLREEFYGRV